MSEMSLEHLVVTESKEVFKEKPKPHNDESVSEKHMSQLKELPMAKAGTILATK